MSQPFPPKERGEKELKRNAMGHCLNKEKELSNHFFPYSAKDDRLTII